MKIGIKNIGFHLPSQYQSNYDYREKFEVDDHFIENKIGFRKVALKAEEEDTSDLCVRAFEDLRKKEPIDLNTIDALVVVTQSPDVNIPHTSAIVHSKLDLPENIACFDISLGCSGFVYALGAVEAMITQHGFRNALLFTADPYSKVVDREDKNTALLFGDAAAVTLVGENPVWASGKYNFGTIGKKHAELMIVEEKLFMNGRAIFEFAARYIPGDIKKLLEKNNLTSEDIDLFALHQGSKYLIDTLVRRTRTSPEKMPFVAGEYGNTVSSSLPIFLAEYLDKPNIKRILISGFGVGLSWASTILARVN